MTHGSGGVLGVRTYPEGAPHPMGVGGHVPVKK